MSDKPIRMFLAFELPQNLRAHLFQVINDLQKGPPDSSKSVVKWVGSANMHLTLKFFGETAPDRIAVIKSAVDETLRKANSLDGFQLQSNGLGAYPNFNYAKVFWANLIGDDIAQLELFAKSLEDEFVRVGFEPEKKRFRPHCTIGRVRPRSNSEAAAEIMREVAEYHYRPIAVTFDQLALIRSELTPAGPIYTTLASWALGVERFGE